MPVFVSWSGDSSRRLALALKRFLPLVIQRLKVFVSSADIAAGTRWSAVLEQNLAVASFGILCVTRDNLTAPWLNFEAGAVANAVGRPRVTPLLLNLSTTEVGPPFSLFQMLTIARNEMFSLVTSINESETEGGLDAAILEATFEAFWDDFELEVRAIRASLVEDKTPIRDEPAILDEVLNILRAMQNQTIPVNAYVAPSIERVDSVELAVALEAKAANAGLTVVRPIQEFDPDLRIQDVGIEVVTLRTGAPNFRKIRIGVQNMKNSIAAGHVPAGVVVVDSITGTAILPGARVADENGVGFVWFRQGRFLGSALARRLSPWLVDDELDIET